MSLEENIEEIDLADEDQHLTDGNYNNMEKFREVLLTQCHLYGVQPGDGEDRMEEMEKYLKKAEIITLQRRGLVGILSEHVDVSLPVDLSLQHYDLADSFMPNEDEEDLKNEL